MPPEPKKAANEAMAAVAALAATSTVLCSCVEMLAFFPLSLMVARDLKVMLGRRISVDSEAGRGQAG